MDTVKSALYFIGVLSVLILVHEWGHFIVAKLCKMRVEDFSLFFGKRLIRLGVRNGTEYNIRTVPLGGFVKIAGMEPDDISNGAPIFRRADKNEGAATQKKFLKTMQGLTEEALEGINLNNVSDRVLRLVEMSLNSEGKLTSEGKAEIRTLLATTGISPEEHKYLEVILAADLYIPDPDGYNQKPLWQRAAVIFAGPFMSLFFGYVLFCGMGFTTGLPDPDNDITTTIAGIEKGKAADLAGLKAGDKILAINGKPLASGTAMIGLIRESARKPLQLTVERNKTSHVYTVTPYEDNAEIIEHGQHVKKKIGRIGIMPLQSDNWKRYSPGEAIKQGSRIIYEQVTMTFQGLFSRHVRENVGGPVAIYGAIQTASQRSYRWVLIMGASLSVSLGIINLFPIPILDGGHLLLLGIEGIRRRKLSSKEIYAAQLVGLSIIGILFVLVMYNDLIRLFTHGKS